MKVVLKPLGAFRHYLENEEKEWEFELPEKEMTVRDLLEISDIESTHIYHNSIVLVNGIQKKMEDDLKDGDRVIITTPMSGG